MNLTGVDILNILLRRSKRFFITVDEPSSGGFAPPSPKREQEDICFLVNIRRGDVFSLSCDGGIGEGYN
jgi:hypothetical protein